MTLSEYCAQLGWDQAEFARRAGITVNTARKALNGEAISSRVARDIADALTNAYGKRILVGDIDDLNVR